MNWHLVIIIAPLLAAVAIAATRFRNPKIRGPALTGTAQILSVQHTTGPSEEGRNLPLGIGLRVQVPGHQPYDVTVKRTVDLIHVARVQTGATFPVQVDATNPQKVRIDFNQPITPQAQSSGWPLAPLGPANAQSAGIDRSLPPPPPVPAGWYPDPNNGQLQRYWDGTRWTENTAPLA
jgi:hypothetical protein